MKKFTNHLTALTLAGLMVLTTASVGAASIYRNVTAKQNTAATVKVNGVNLTLKDDDDDQLYPLTYDGVTYLPAKQLANALGYDAAVSEQSVSLSSKDFAASAGDIGAEKAKQIALNHAGLSASQVSFIKVDADYDDGRKEYEIEFYSGNKEYDYEILASNGKIVSVDYDIENYSIPSTSSSSSKKYISLEAAKQAALKHAGLSSSQVRFEKAELDHDDGRAEYELEWKSNSREYECVVDASTGKILEFERD